MGGCVLGGAVLCAGISVARLTLQRLRLRRVAVAAPIPASDARLAPRTDSRLRYDSGDEDGKQTGGALSLPPHLLHREEGGGKTGKNKEQAE